MENEAENQTVTKEKPRVENVALNVASIQKINRWFEQIEKKKVKLSRKDLINWFIEKSPENLSNSDLNAIYEKFYDEEAFLRQLLRDVKKAKQEGHVETIEFIVKSKKNEPKKDLNSDADQI